MLKNLTAFLVDNPPIENAFEPINVGSQHFRIEAWNSLVRAGILPLLSIEQQSCFQDADKSIREIARRIQIDNADWKRILQFYEWDKKNKSAQLAPIQDTFYSIKRTIKYEMERAMNSIERALDKLNEVNLST